MDRIHSYYKKIIDHHRKRVVFSEQKKLKKQKYMLEKKLKLAVKYKIAHKAS